MQKVHSEVNNSSVAHQVDRSHIFSTYLATLCHLHTSRILTKSVFVVSDQVTLQPHKLTQLSERQFDFFFLGGGGGGGGGHRKIFSGVIFFSPITQSCLFICI